uniref:NADH dehydrogenase subunit 2 n=1 Tax=Hexamermis agrotis TaxID=387665 RepID=A2TN55_9BILA|nr:NADH dehydrogenase subunit 2 [Hexamermis agrotis]ABM79872.1 NADH dehydrogenase subunit 2 [Hexamermis agrotis]
MAFKTNKFLILYLMLIMMSLNLSSWWWLWLSFELLNWLLMLIMNSNYLMVFLLWQSLSSLSIVYSLIFINKFMFIFLLMKMGLPPFHYWVIYSQKMWSFLSFIMFISVHKYLPTIILINMISWMNWSVLLLPIGLLFFWSNNYMKFFIFGISIMDMFWMIMSWEFSLKLLMVYLVINFLMMLMLWTINSSNINLKSYDMQLILVFLLNMPPFLTFMIKWMIIGMMTLMLSIISLFLSLLPILMVWFWLSLNLIQNSMMMNKVNKNMMYMVLLTILWIF